MHWHWTTPRCAQPPAGAQQGLSGMVMPAQSQSQSGKPASTACRAAEILNEAMAADQRVQLQNYTHQLGQRDSEFAAMRQRMDDLRYFHIAGCDWRIKQETMYTFKAAS